MERGMDELENEPAQGRAEDCTTSAEHHLTELDVSLQQAQLHQVQKQHFCT